MIMKQLHTVCILLLWVFSIKPVNAQEIIRINKKYALVSKNKTLYPAEFDSAYSEYSRDYYFLGKNGKWAIVDNKYLDTIDWVHFTPRYDSIIDFSSWNSAFGYLVYQKGKCGALSRKLVPTIAVNYDSIFRIGMLTAIKKGNKLALIQPKHDTLKPGQEFAFIYDELLPQTKENPVNNFRIGNKYGFCYEKTYRSPTRTVMTPAVYDEPIQNNYDLYRAKKGDSLFYFFENNFSESSLFDKSFESDDSFDLEIGSHVRFIDAVTNQTFYCDGPKRIAKCYRHFPYLLVEINNSKSVFCYNYDTRKTEYFYKSPGSTYEFICVNLNWDHYSDGEREVWFVKKRTLLNDGTAEEKIIRMPSGKEVFSARIPDKNTLVFQSFRNNAHYLKICEKDEHGQIIKPKGYFQWQIPWKETFSGKKPPRDPNVFRYLYRDGLAAKSLLFFYSSRKY